MSRCPTCGHKPAYCDCQFDEINRLADENQKLSAKIEMLVKYAGELNEVIQQERNLSYERWVAINEFHYKHAALVEAARAYAYTADRVRFLSVLENEQ